MNVSVSWRMVGSGKRRLAKVQLEREAMAASGSPVWGAVFLQSQVKDLPERWSPPSLLCSPRLGLGGEFVSGVGGNLWPPGPPLGMDWGPLPGLR